MKQALGVKGLLALACYVLMVSAASAAPSTGALFEQLLEESGMRFSPPPDFTDAGISSNPVLHYESALRHASAGLEIRYIIRPLGRIAIDYNDPHNAAPEPNHLFPLLFESLTNELSSGGNTHHSDYPQSEARELFNADWAAASVFDVNPDFSKNYSEALLIGMHKDGQADAYMVFLYNDYSQVKATIRAAFTTLTFAP